MGKAIAIRAKTILPLAGEKAATGKELFAPLKKIDNAVLLVEDGIVCSVQSWYRADLPSGVRVHDAGDVCLVPGVINAHCHLELSVLAGRTCWHQGYVSWLRSLIPQLGLLAADQYRPAIAGAAEQAALDMAATGTAHVGNYACSLACGLAVAESACRNAGLASTQFCEIFGHAAPFLDHELLTACEEILAAPELADKPDRSGQGGQGELADLDGEVCGVDRDPSEKIAGPALPGQNRRAGVELSGKPSQDRPGIWPVLSRQLLADNPLATIHAAPCGHTLYSSSPLALRAAMRFCRDTGRVFAYRLAESPEEMQLLQNGGGALRDCLAGAVIPDDWKAPGMSPTGYADSLGLLGNNVLAIHGTRLASEEIGLLAASGTALCLCPRSNKNLGIGQPPVHELIDKDVLLCLGTGGLTSNTDLDVRAEAVHLRENLDLPPEALIRMMTVNANRALRLGRNFGATLEPGTRAFFSRLPDALTF